MARCMEGHARLRIHRWTRTEGVVEVCRDGPGNSGRGGVGGGLQAFLGGRCRPTVVVESWRDQLFEFDQGEEDRQIARLHDVRRSRSEADAAGRAASNRQVGPMVGLEIQGFPLPVGDEAVIAIGGEEGQLRRCQPAAGHHPGRSRRRYRGRDYGRAPRRVGRIHRPGRVLGTTLTVRCL